MYFHYTLVLVLVFASPSALFGRTWFPGCLSAAPANSGLADRRWRCLGKRGAVCPQGHVPPCLQALHVRPGKSGPLTVLWVLTLSVAWYSLWFSGLRHFRITSLMLAGELWWQTEGEVWGRINTQVSLLLAGMSSGMIKSTACVSTFTCLSRYGY